jgi:hypothetical protein
MKMIDPNNAPQEFALQQAIQEAEMFDQLEREAHPCVGLSIG